MTTTVPPFRVFVSSTSEDLKTYRKAVMAAIRRLGSQEVAMEAFGARPGAPVAECVDAVRSADAVVVIVAQRLGWVPGTEKGGDGVKSVTRIEVEAAVAAKLPVFAFVSGRWRGKSERDQLTATSTEAEALAVRAALQALRDFRAYLEARFVRDTFDGKKDLEAKVATSLGRWLLGERQNRLAPQPPDDTPALAAYLKEVENAHARVDIQGIASRAGASRLAMSFAIEEIYTPLRSLGASGGEDGDACDDAPGGRMGLRGDRVLLSELLARHRHLLLVGDPGSGKTTFLRLVACVLARDLRHAEEPGHAPQRAAHLGLPADLPPPVPVFLRLAGLAERMGNDHGCPEDACSHRWLLRGLGHAYGEAAGAALERRLEAGQAVLLLDGLDEVADEALRRRVVSAVDAALSRWGAGNRVVVSSRPFGYEGVASLAGVRTVRIDDFGEAEIREYLGRWTAGLAAAGTPPPEGQRRDDLERAIVAVPRIRRMAKNPVMLTCLCVVHWNERHLPEGKADLLAAVLRWLVAARSEQRKAHGWTDTLATECFKALALDMTTSPDGKLAQVDLAWAARALAKPFEYERGVTDPVRVEKEGRRLLEDEALDGGIVVRTGVGQLRFWHLTFQEHFAACALSEPGGDWWGVVRPHLADPQWAEVIDHLAGCLANTGRAPLRELVGHLLGLAESGRLVDTAVAVGALGRVRRVLEAYDFRPPDLARWEAVRARVERIFTPEGAREVPVADRIAAAEGLGRAGDLRFTGGAPEVLAVPTCPGLRLGKYPVTVVEYARFVEHGYAERRHWDEEGWSFRERLGWSAPGDWDTQQETPNRPVTGVSWFEAAAYCAWLGSATGQPLRLPLEAEWAAAATHAGGPYPWGAEEPDPERANFGDSKLGAPTPVGVYPTGAGPFGHLDLAGNVGEWCADVVEKPEYAEWFFKELGKQCGLNVRPALRALRGGGFWVDAGRLRSVRRFGLAAVHRLGSVGFRVASLPQSTAG